MCGSLLVDLDGVVRTWDPLHVAAVEERYDLPAGSIAIAAFGDEGGLRQAVTGQITDAEWRSRIAGRLSSLCGDSADAVVAEWSTPAGAVDSDVLAILRSARRAGWRVGLLTNATTRLQADLIRLELDGEFDVVVNQALARTKRDSNGRRKAARRLGRMHARIAAIRKALLHSISSEIAKGSTVVVIEDLNAAGMLRNRKLARHISDAGFAELRRQLEYKSVWYGTELVVADRRFPSSKTCSGCGEVKADLTLSDRVYERLSCGLVIDRDLNAAINLARYTPPANPSGAKKTLPRPAAA